MQQVKLSLENRAKSSFFRQKKLEKGERAISSFN
jgi:hypothetical protein